MPTIIELTAEIVSSHASANQLTQEQLVEEIHRVHALLKGLESGTSVVVDASSAPAPEQPKITVKQAFKKDEVICMVCGKGGFKTLKRHLGQAHGMKPGEYKRQFNIPASVSLVAKSYSEKRKATAIASGLGENFKKARAVRAENLAKGKGKSKAKKPAK